MNKKGFLRILESVIAILIITGVMLAINLNKPEVSDDSYYYEIISSSLKEISKTNNLRSEIIREDTKQDLEVSLNDFVKERIKDGSLEFNIKVCEVQDICSIDYPENSQGNVYSEQVIISSDLTQFNPKKVKMFLWRKAIFNR